ncbi:MAG: patatin-like phospholipase family protein [Cyclobacteriaceae bacterium]
MIKSFMQKIGFGKARKYKRGIALGGGGARGFVHLGVLQALKERDAMPEIISGTSAGAMVGAFVASGMEPVEVNQLLKDKDLFSLSKILWPKDGLLSLAGMRELLEKEIKQKNIEDLEIPFIVAVTNLNKGCVEYLSSGSLADGVLASSSIPFVFKPIMIGDSKYADGGIIDNLPIKPIIDDCEKVVAVSISPLEETDDLDGLLKIGARTFQLSVNAQVSKVKERVSLFIEPEGLREYDLFDIKKADELFELGYTHANSIESGSL